MIKSVSMTNSEISDDSEDYDIVETTNSEATTTNYQYENVAVNAIEYDHTIETNESEPCNLSFDQVTLNEDNDPNASIIDTDKGIIEESNSKSDYEEIEEPFNLNQMSSEKDESLSACCKNVEEQNSCANTINSAQTEISEKIETDFFIDKEKEMEVYEYNAKKKEDFYDKRINHRREGVIMIISVASIIVLIIAVAYFFYQRGKLAQVSATTDKVETGGISTVQLQHEQQQQQQSQSPPPYYQHYYGYRPNSTPFYPQLRPYNQSRS